VVVASEVPHRYTRLNYLQQVTRNATSACRPTLKIKIFLQNMDKTWVFNTTIVKLPVYRVLADLLPSFELPEGLFFGHSNVKHLENTNGRNTPQTIFFL
jgi:hypothetical protein